MISPKCPYCGGELKGAAALPPLSARQSRILNAVIDSGAKGIPTPELLVRMYAEDEWPTPGGPVVLRVQIHYINTLLAPLGVKIRGVRKGIYYFVSTRGTGNGTTTQEENTGTDHPDR